MQSIGGTTMLCLSWRGASSLITSKALALGLATGRATPKPTSTPAPYCRCRQQQLPSACTHLAKALALEVAVQPRQHQPLVLMVGGVAAKVVQVCGRRAVGEST